MRERIRDLGGHLIIQPSTPGTLISVTLPITQQEQDARVALAD
jgi:signal transduction histidine kinase